MIPSAAITMVEALSATKENPVGRQNKAPQYDWAIRLALAALINRKWPVSRMFRTVSP
jgi:hypothetical protein